MSSPPFSNAWAQNQLDETLLYAAKPVVGTARPVPHPLDQGDAEARLLFSQANGQCAVMLVFAPYVPKDASAL